MLHPKDGATKPIVPFSGKNSGYFILLSYPPISFFSVYTAEKTVAIFFRFAIIISSYFIMGRHSTSVVYQLPKLRRRVRFPLSAYSKKPSKVSNALILLGFHMFKIFLFRKKFTSKSILFTSKYSTMYSTKCYPSFASSTYY